MRQFIMLASLICFACDDETSVDYNPCKFPPVTSNFPKANQPLGFNYLGDCTSCFLTLNVGGQIYRFTNDQIEVISTSPVYEIANPALFNIAFRSPINAASLLALNGSFNDFTLSRYSLFNEPLPAATMYLELRDYCQKIFISQVQTPRPDSEFSDRSIHKILDVKIIKLNYFNNYSGDFEVTGELGTSIIRDGEYIPVSGTYKIIIRNLPF